MAAWTWVPAGCNVSLTPEISVCMLHRTVNEPESIVSTGCRKIASGTRAAAEGILPLRYKPLKLGSIKVSGWLRQQLIVMANGLSGHLDLFWQDVNESVWIGGQYDHSGAGHERGPYWLNGMVPLVAQLNATGDTSKLVVDINSQVEHWIHYILEHQQNDGWLGPDDGFGGKGNTYWTGWNTAASLLSYADAMPIGDPMATRCNKAVFNYISCVYERMKKEPTTTWTQNRWQDWVYIIHWQLDQASFGQEQLLWDAAELTQKQSWDWDAYYAQTGVGSTGAYVGKPIPKFPEANVGHWTMWDHGVNNAMGTKSCATWYRQSRNDTDAKRSYHKLAMQDLHHGQPHGMFSADECFGGRNLNRGIELCAVVEQLYSLQHMFRVLGDPIFMDRHERIQYNSLPGTITPNSWAHQYLQQANEINARYGIKDHVWQCDGPDSTGFGVQPNVGCCTANMQQGWPKLVNNILLERADGALVLALIAPFEAQLQRQGNVSVDTAYPFGDSVSIMIANPENTFDFMVRIPGWADSATAVVTAGDNHAIKHTPANGTMFSVVCVSGKNTHIKLELNPSIRVEKGWGQLGVKSLSPVQFSKAGASVPTSDQNDYLLSGGASFASDPERHSQDIRTGDPGQISTIALAHPIDGAGHNITQVTLSFRYVAGFGPRGTIPGKSSPTVAVDLVEPISSTVHTVWTSGPLDAASFDEHDKFSPPVKANAVGLSVPNAKLMTLQLRVNNGGRNLQIDLASISIEVYWSATRTAGPAPPVSPYLIPPTNAATVVRGPLVYSLLLEETCETVRTWEPFNNIDMNLDTSSTWNVALLLDRPISYERVGNASKVLPFNNSNFPSVVKASARILPGWTEAQSAANEPPASPINCKSVLGGCGSITPIVLVPYGMTDLRMAALPFIVE